MVKYLYIAKKYVLKYLYIVKYIYFSAEKSSFEN